MNGKKEYVKLWLSYQAYFESYTPEQVGDLVLAMLEYKGTGKEPEFYGPERFIWPAVKRDIDEAQAAQDAGAQHARENGKRGGRPPKKPPEEPEENPAGFSETQKTPWTKDMDKDNGHCHGQGQGEGQGQGCAQAREKMAAADRLLARLMREAKEEAAAEETELFT